MSFTVNKEIEDPFTVYDIISTFYTMLIITPFLSVA